MSSLPPLVPTSLISSLRPHLDSLASLYVPRPLKWLLWVYLLANVNGWPGVWHARIIWPFLKFQWQVKLGKKWVNDRIGKDELTHAVDAATRRFRATPDSCDSFGMHLSNSEYAVTVDHVRGPFAIQLVGEFYMIPGATFALGATHFAFQKEIPLMAKFEVENSLLGYDKKWVYILTTFRSLPHPKTGARSTYAQCVSHLVLKHNRRTIPPCKAFALAGYDSSHGKGEANWEIAKAMTAGEKLKWLAGDDEGGKGKGLVVGDVERGMERKSEWPCQLGA
ncbi:hypothetical protein JCM11641_001795 [Rhodosporidiobolus odoratus]